MAFVTQGDPIPSSQSLTEPPSTSLPNGTSDPTDTVQIEQHPTVPMSSTSAPSTDPCTTSNTTPAAPVNTLSTSQTTVPAIAATGSTTTPDIPPFNVGRMHHPFPSSSVPVASPPSPRRQSMILFVRMLLLVSVAVLTSVSWPEFSAFKTFICLRALLALPSLKPSYGRSQLQPQRRSNWTLLDIVTSLPRAYVTIQTIWQEFALFMTVTLLTISLMRAS